MKTATLALLLLASTFGTAAASPESDFFNALGGDGAAARALGEAQAWREGRLILAAAKAQKLRDDAPMDFGSEKMAGTLTLTAGHEVALRAVGGAGMVLVNGSVELKYGKPSLTSFFSGDRRVALTQNGATAVFQTSSSHYKTFGDFVTADDSPQGLALKGSQVTTETGRREREGKTSCTYSGYCLQCGPSFNMDGSLSNDCSARFRLNCGGSQPTRERVISYSRVKTIDILALPSKEKLGAVLGAPETFEQSSIIETTGSCR